MRCISQPRSKLLVLIASTSTSSSASATRNGYAYRNADPDPDGDRVPDPHRRGNTNTHGHSDRYASARRAVASTRDSEPSQGDAYSTPRHSHTGHRAVWR